MKNSRELPSLQETSLTHQLNQSDSHNTQKKSKNSTSESNTSLDLTFPNESLISSNYFLSNKMSGNNIKMSLGSLSNYETQSSVSEAHLVNESAMGDDFSWDMARAFEDIDENMSDIFPGQPSNAQVFEETYTGHEENEDSVSETDHNPIDPFDAETDRH